LWAAKERLTIVLPDVIDVVIWWRVTAFDPCGVPHMETSVRYLEFAVKCDRLAKLAKSEEDRMMLKEMAEAWKKVAREAAKKEDSTERRIYWFLLFPICGREPEHWDEECWKHPVAINSITSIICFSTVD
jgi:hypothetical protein